MKKNLAILLLVASLGSFAQTRHSAKDLFTEKTIVWYGIDYSNAKFIGSFGQFKDAGAINGNTLRDKYFKGWNNVVIREYSKYNIAKFFHKESSVNDISSVEKINSETDPSKLMQEGDYILPASELAGMVKKYVATDMKDGLGAVFITESYNHTKALGSYYVVVFDIASKEILISEKFSTEPAGIGIKNYWAGTIFKTLEGVDEKYSNWKKTYGK